MPCKTRVCVDCGEPAKFCFELEWRKFSMSGVEMTGWDNSDIATVDVCLCAKHAKRFDDDFEYRNELLQKVNERH